LSSLILSFSWSGRARGKWFAAAKDAGFLDVALLCARDYAAEPATLVRAARDFADKEPKFARQGDFGVHRLDTSRSALTWAA
jgi:hypothetical protein